MGAELLRFSIAGTCGFLVDTALTLVLTQMLGLGYTSGRVIAFVVAATVTWLLNRRFTFRSSAGGASWLPYLALTSAGALINIGIYRIWISMAGALPAQIVLGIALGSICALALNFLVARHFVFAVPVAHSASDRS